MNTRVRLLVNSIVNKLHVCLFDFFYNNFLKTPMFKKFITRNNLPEHFSKQRWFSDLVSRPSDYNFDDFYKTQTIHSINVPKVIYNTNDLSKYPPPEDNHVCTVHKECDMVKSFIVHGKNIRKIHITIGGQVVWKSYYLNAGLVKVTPFEFGIMLVNLAFSTVEIHVDCDNLYETYVIGLILNTQDRRRLCQSRHEFDYIFYDKGKLYNKMIIEGGVCGLVENVGMKN